MTVLARLDRWLPPDLPPHTLRPARHLALLAAITGASVPLLMLLYHWLGFDPAAIAVLCAGIVMVAAPLLLHAGLGFEAACNLFITGLFVLKIWLAANLGGLGAASTAWFVLCPLVAALLGGARPALVWSALVFKTYVVLFLWGRFISPLVPYPVSAPDVLAFAGQLGLLVMASAIALLFCGERD